MNMDITKEIAEYIKAKTVVDLNSLKKKFPGRSEPSMRRDLAKLKCISCFTHNSRYYTLPDIPKYDAHGLWRHGGIIFSKYSTAKETVRMLISNSPSGLSHTELQQMLGIRLYNPLRALIGEKALSSISDGSKIVFFNRDEAISQRQKNNRSEKILAIADHPFNLTTVIDVLLAVFLEDRNQVESAYKYLKLSKHPYITIEEVEKIFIYYKLPGKKN